MHNVVSNIQAKFFHLYGGCSQVLTGGGNWSVWQKPPLDAVYYIKKQKCRICVIDWQLFLRRSFLLNWYSLLKLLYFFQVEIDNTFQTVSICIWISFSHLNKHFYQLDNTLLNYERIQTSNLDLLLFSYCLGVTK